MMCTIKLIFYRFVPFHRVRTMQSWLISWIVFCAVGIVFPCCLLVFAWRRNRKVTSPLIVPMIATIVLVLAMIPAMRSAILGGDYSRRLFVTIDVFAALTLINAIYAAIRKAWATAIALSLIHISEP